MSNQAAKRYHGLTDRALGAVTRLSHMPQTPAEVAELPHLSILVVLGTLVTLGNRIRALGMMEIGISLIFSWQRPTLTISMLLMWSYCCYSPHLFLAVPLVVLLGKELVPNYARTFGLIPPPVDHDEPEFEHDGRIIASEEPFDIFTALRTGQAKLKKVVELLDRLDAFIAGPASFKKDPRTSCLLLASVLCAVFLIVVGGKFISFSFLFVSGAWIAAFFTIPQVKAMNLRPPKPPIEPIRRELEIAKDQFCIDDNPLTLTVEVFELQQQGLTPRLWEPRGFSPYVYTTESRFRVHQQLPPGEKSIDDIVPPEGWNFVENDEWKPTSTDWAARRGIKGVNLNGEWAIDIDSDWRRRRWSRLCCKKLS